MKGGEIMAIVQYDCTVKCGERSITVPVFTASKDKAVIRKIAIRKTEEHLQDFEIPYSKEDIKPVGYRNRGSFEVMPVDENI